MNLIDALLEDHRAVERLFGDVSTATGVRREEMFAALRENLVRHEVAEEEIVRPLTKSSFEGGPQVAQERSAEESEAEKLLKQMEKEEVGSAEWVRLFGALRSGVLEHAEKEETLEFPRLRSNVEASELESKGKLFESAKKLAPTHPHPGAPNTAAANVALGPVAALIDRARDALAKAKSA